MEDVAVEITDVVLKGLNSYYGSLAILGSRPQSDVDKLLVLSFLEEVLTGKMGFFITEKDYRIIEKALNCLYGSCLIPFPEYQGSSLFGTMPDDNNTNPSITEDNNIRFTEDDAIRFRS